MGCLRLTYWQKSLGLKVEKGNLNPLSNSSAGVYRYGFNGMEKDDEVSGSGNHTDFGARGYSNRLGRWWSVDKVVKPQLSSYQFGRDNPILFIDPDGNTEYIYYTYINEKGETYIQLVQDGSTFAYHWDSEYNTDGSETYYVQPYDVIKRVTIDKSSGKTVTTEGLTTERKSKLNFAQAAGSDQKSGIYFMDPNGNATPLNQALTGDVDIINLNGGLDALLALQVAGKQALVLSKGMTKTIVDATKVIKKTTEKVGKSMDGAEIKKEEVVSGDSVKTNHHWNKQKDGRYRIDSSTYTFYKDGKKIEEITE